MGAAGLAVSDDATEEADAAAGASEGTTTAEGNVSVRGTAEGTIAVDGEVGRWVACAAAFGAKD